jgi:histidyl-tRNA synthetase
MKRANKLDSAAAILMGSDELARGKVTIKDLDEGTQQEVDLDKVSDHLMQYR